MAGTSEIELDLHAVVDRLLLLKADVQSYCAVGDLQGARRNQIAFAIRQVGERALALEDVVMRVGAPVVVVTAKRAAAESLRCAVHRLAHLESIDDAEPFDDVVSCVVDALHAADVVALRAAGGRSDVAVHHDVQIRRVAGTTVSRTGVVVARIGPRPPVCDADDGAVRSVGH